MEQSGELQDLDRTNRDWGRGERALNACTTFLSSSLLLRPDSGIHEEVKERKKGVDLQVREEEACLTPSTAAPANACARPFLSSCVLETSIPAVPPACCSTDSSSRIAQRALGLLLVVSGSDSCPPARSCTPSTRHLSGGSAESLSSEEQNQTLNSITPAFSGLLHPVNAANIDSLIFRFLPDLAARRMT